MWLKKCTCFLLACVAVFGCLFTPVAAAELGEQKVEIEERRASGKFDFDIPAKTLMKASSSFPMEYGETVKTSYNITLTDASGKNQLTSSPITLGAGRHTNITNSNAASGMRYLTVTAQDGSALDGTVRIRLASSADELANG